jgi:hypothetical protein
VAKQLIEVKIRVTITSKSLAQLTYQSNIDRICVTSLFIKVYFQLIYYATYRTISLPVVWYGCETWSLTFREEHRLRVYERSVLRIFGPKRHEVTGEWRKLHNEELHILYSSPSVVLVIKSRRMRWAGHVAQMGEERVVYRGLVGIPEGKRPLGRPRHR